MTKKLPRPPSLVLSFTVVLLLVFSPRAAYSQVFQSRSPNCNARLGKATPVSSTAGWAMVTQPSDNSPKPSADAGDCTAEHLYWTDNNGQVWREITPLHMPAEHLGSVFFLDRTYGWMISSDTDR